MKDKIVGLLARAVVNMDENAVVQLCREAMQTGMQPQEVIEQGLARGMEEVGNLFAAGEYFVPEIVVCSDAMYAGLDFLKPFMLKKIQPKGRVLIGVVEGDTHDIGKNIVIMMLEAAGFEIHDLGRNVSLGDFSRKAAEVDADIVALSSLMTTTMEGMKVVVEDLRVKSGRRRFVMVGGAPVSYSFAKRIGADGYSPNANGAVKLARKFMGLGD